MHKTDAERMYVAKRVVGGIRRWLPDATTELRGSVAAQRTDAFSDIDISLHYDRIPHQQLVSLLIMHMRQHHHVLFHDCAKSFLPEECVIAFFLADLPPCCFIEISVTVTPEMQDLTPGMIANDNPAHGLKLWVIAARRIARCANTSPLELNLLSRNSDLPDSLTPVPRLRSAIESLRASASEQYPRFLEGCLGLMETIERMYPSANSESALPGAGF